MVVQYTQQISSVGFHGVVYLLKSWTKYYVYCFEGRFLLILEFYYPAMSNMHVMLRVFDNWFVHDHHFLLQQEPLFILIYNGCVSPLLWVRELVIGISVDVTLKYGYKHWVHQIWSVLFIILAARQNYWLVMSDVSLRKEAIARVRGQTNSSVVVWFHHVCLSFPSYESTIFES